MTDDLESKFDVDVRGELPDSIDEASVERIQTVAYLLDESVSVPGTPLEIGLDPVLSFVPVVGDAIGAGLSLYIVAESAYLGVTYTTLVRMLANVTVDVVGGAVPYVGPLFDAFWKSNKRNFELALQDLAVETGPSGDDFVDIEVEEPP